MKQEMHTLTTALRTADLKPSDWYTPGQLAVMLRSAYDPGVAATLERSGTIGHDSRNGRSRRGGRDLGGAAIG